MVLLTHSVLTVVSLGHINCSGVVFVIYFKHWCVHAIHYDIYNHLISLGICYKIDERYIADSPRSLHTLLAIAYLLYTNNLSMLNRIAEKNRV